ncbi:6-bladed beta-propeller [Algoriphagus marinus]|uniref:6-bladed beta-propeller n=1 Tax=Algoriphagus marinus TaxID=1925762 RepID=UPI00094BC655|nr:6-bladed beta-propeller [Algoriphagus marinus]
MKKLFPIILIALFACGESEESGPITIQFDKLEAITPDFEIQKVILLESDTTELLGSDLKVSFDSDQFYVANYNRPKGIHHFSKEGRHLGFAAVIGEAPGQIRRFSDFKLYQDTLHVIEGLGDKINLYKYSPSNELISTQEYPINVFSFQPAEKGYWFYSGYNKVAGTHRLIKTDQNGEIKLSLLENLFADEMLPIDEQVFFKGDNRILFREPFKTMVYEMESDTIQPVIKIDFGKYTVPEKFWEMTDPFASFEMIQEQGFSDIYFMAETADYFFADVITQSSEFRKKELFILNKKTQKQLKFLVDEEGLGQFYSPIGIEGDQVVFIAYAPYLIKNLNSIKASPAILEQLSKLSEDSNPVILYAKIPE